MSPKAFTPEEKQRVYATKTYILNHLHHSLPLIVVARHAAMTIPKFKEVFQALFNYLPSHYIHEARMQLSFFLLRHTDKTVKEVALLCGYKNYKNFLTAFKHYFERTPGSLR